MYSTVKNIRVSGIAAAVSNHWDSVRELSDEPESVINKFIKTTGVEGRYSASPNQCTSDFCYTAAEQLLEKKSIERGEIGALIYVTQTADYRIPATACVLQKRLGLSENLLAFDINLGCSGFVYGLYIISAIMQTSEMKYALLLAGDTSAREFSQKEKTKTSHSGSLLFGDAGTATLIEKKDASDITFSLNTDGYQYEAIFAPYGFWRHPEAPANVGNSSQMDEIGVFNFATSKVPDQINEYMNRMGTTQEDYDCLVLHQANAMILKRIGKKTGFPVEKIPISMAKFGNTSSSSIPLSLVDEYGDKVETKNINALCCGFGVGLSWATAGIELNSNDIIPLIHTDNHFDDGI